MRDEDLKIEIHRLEANVAQLGELVTQNFISLLEIKEQIISVRDHLERLEKEEKLYRKNFNHLIIRIFWTDTRISFVYDCQSFLKIRFKSLKEKASGTFDFAGGA